VRKDSNAGSIQISLKGYLWDNMTPETSTSPEAGEKDPPVVATWQEIERRSGGRGNGGKVRRGDLVIVGLGGYELWTSPSLKNRKRKTEVRGFLAKERRRKAR